ncbi:bifunctional 5,10-methylenetetrahydrofolate dehydrogenase/5,10-methenyltetrahydrofolate cyclohydrolase [Bacteriovorax sp. Seq25_V]|uniref:bifunctional 5,10-methylenetetrahydrofolate dehydrogenase/5,10-methenyltetrahydrofolate cyclohydrolase n=1 Tax=Bacteriovorax sp. Seq25_V TaxID=1201288 RepID=UPI000389E4AC|nr:bifunctional 5,10-methylenetetrahydrofolate dehydrogenase/5,10-methenyltetrahydrofolate cyclohydrolase [Bacteriovorax sp. Seq25_V]EQC43414.1 tetrahydrofolate dehydrogenase/cyclohydrolase, NAD(P)-binding domain protein [Bacteriovorax sp. Seq25_V]
MTEILYAKPAIDAELEALKSRTAKIKQEHGVIPTLRVILVGNDPGSIIYTNSKKKFCEKIGADCEIIKLDESVEEKVFLSEVDKLNKDMNVHAVLIQLPLPKHLSHIDTTNLVLPSKDVDGFHSENISRLYRNDKSETGLVPCTPKGILTLAKHYNFNFASKNVVIIGRSLIVGKPLSLLLTNLDATVTLAHSKTHNLKDLCLRADIIISACGKPKFLTSDYFRTDQSQIVIDVGINRLPNGTVCGDCDFDSIKDQLSAITPVPKGVGPMTIFSVAQNLLHALENSL